MKQNLFTSLIVALIAIAMTGCSKSAQDKLTDHAWVLTSMKITIDGVTFDAFSLFQACEKDDQTIFNEDGTVSVDQGAIKCVSTDPQTAVEGTWSLASDDKTLTMVSDGVTTVWTATKLESDLLEATGIYADLTDPTISGTVTASWAKP